MKCSFLIVFVLVLTSCLTPRQGVQRIERDTLYLFVTDTVVRSFPLYVADTVFVEQPDSIVFDWKNATTTVILKHDTLWRWRVKTQVRNDTVFLEKYDTVVVERRVNVIPPLQDESGPLPWWLFIIVAAVASFFGYNFQKKKK